MIQLNHITLIFDKMIFDNISITITSGHFISIDGESGSGKSTLIKLILGQIHNYDGDILYDDKILDDQQRDKYIQNYIFYIDQMGNYFPNMTIKEHFKFYSELYHIDNYDINTYLHKVNLDDIDIKKSPEYLSTGERKRFILALALMVNKDIIMIDEPTASLDATSKTIILNVLKELVNNGKTVLASTHDQTVLDVSDKIYIIKDKKLTLKKDCEYTEMISHPLQMYKVSYHKYKNNKIRLFNAFLIILECLCLIMISLSSSKVVGYINFINEEYAATNSSGLILYKDLNGDNEEISSDSNFIDTQAIISDEELSEISKVDGIKNIDLNYRFYISQGDPIEIQVLDENNNVIVESDNDYTYEDGLTLHTEIIIQSYHPYQNIKHNGQTISGIYISEELQKHLNYDIHNVTLKLIDNIGYDIEICTSLNPIAISRDILNNTQTKVLYTLENIKWYEENSTYLGEIEFEIAGTLLSNEYDVSDDYTLGYSSQYVIYMPADEVKALYDKYYDGEGEPYHPRAYFVYCEEGMSDSVKQNIEAMDSSYHVYYQSNGIDSALQFFDLESIMTLISNTLIISIICFVCTLCLGIYSIYQRRHEISLLKNNALTQYIPSYYRKDYIINTFVCLLLSVVGLIITYNYIYFDYGITYIFVWIATSLIVALMIYLIERYAIKVILEKDYSK
ncbi:MAG: ABC transporter ATP-binding protein [Erysipelotrichaceae bacterium]|nr:ABC transporter ATP-binding protein [Erysipelotrichaceae bacterium]